MNILFDIGHPAHVHLFKNFMLYLIKKDISFDVVTRDKEVTNRLLEYYNIPFKSVSKAKSGFLRLFFELIYRDIVLYKMYLKNKYNLLMGTSASIGHISFLHRGNVQSWNFSEDDDDVIPLQAFISYPTSSKIINPDCIKYKRWKNKRVLVPSLHELAYLHPNNFTPNETILKKYGLIKGKYVILRLSALKAHHDYGAKGISPSLKKKITYLLKEFDIVESFESKIGNKIEPWDMHHILAFAKMIISDSQTMAAESMVLGIPSVRINSFVGKISSLEELENKYNLGFGYLPNEEDPIVHTIQYLSTNENIEKLWHEKRKKLLFEKIDFNQWLINHFEKEVMPGTALVKTMCEANAAQDTMIEESMKTYKHLLGK